MARVGGAFARDPSSPLLAKRTGRPFIAPLGGWTLHTLGFAILLPLTEALVPELASALTEAVALNAYPLTRQDSALPAEGEALAAGLPFHEPVDPAVANPSCQGLGHRPRRYFAQRLPTPATRLYLRHFLKFLPPLAVGGASAGHALFRANPAIAGARHSLRAH